MGFLAFNAPSIWLIVLEFHIIFCFKNEFSKLKKSLKTVDFGSLSSLKRGENRPIWQILGGLMTWTVLALYGRYFTQSLHQP